jgi:hypothetical protein
MPLIISSPRRGCDRCTQYRMPIDAESRDVPNDAPRCVHGASVVTIRLINLYRCSTRQHYMTFCTERTRIPCRVPHFTATDTSLREAFAHATTSNTRRLHRLATSRCDDSVIEDTPGTLGTDVRSGEAWRCFHTSSLNRWT